MMKEEGEPVEKCLPYGEDLSLSEEEKMGSLDSLTLVQQQMLLCVHLEVGACVLAGGEQAG